MIQVGSYIRWSSSRPDIRFDVFYEKQRNGVDMKYRIKTYIYPLSQTNPGGTFGYNIVEDISLDGISFLNGYQLKDNTSTWSTAREYTTDWFTLSNKVDGTTRLTLRLYSTTGSSRNETYNFDLAIDPAYANINQGIGNRTETTISMNWNSDYALSHIWYSTNGGSTWNDVGDVNSTSGSYTISGLNANTTYNIITKGRRSGTTLDSTTQVLQQNTYPYPYANSMPSFVIGNAVSVGIYNPLGRNITINLLDKNDTSVYTTSGTISNFTATIDGDSLYASIPNQQSANYKVKVSYSGNNDVKTGGAYTINTSVCSPSITSVSYEDKFADTLAITSDSSILISGYSKTTFTATGLTTLKSATIKRVELRLASLNNAPLTNLTVAGTSASVDNIVLAYNNTTDKDIYITLIDSRDLTYTKKITIDLRAYSTPTFTYSVKRQSNFYTATDFLVNANFTAIGSNSITIKTRYKKLEDNTWSNWTNLTNNTISTINLDNAYVWNVEFEIKDALWTWSNITTSVGKGTPALFVDTTKSSVGVNCFPSLSDSFEVNDSPVNTNFKWGSTACGNWFGNTMYRNCYEGNLSVNLNDNTFFLQSQGIGQTPNIVDVNVVLYDPVERIVYKLPHYDKTSRDNDIFSPEYWIYDGSPNDDYLEVFGKGMPTIMQKAFDNEWTYKLIVYYTESVG